MTNQEKLETFRTELNYIKNQEIKTFTETILQNTPDYFFTVGASSTGKYHPDYAVGFGGLIRHTQASVRIAVEMFRIADNGSAFSSDEEDIIIASLILHDSVKHGINESKYVLSTHPLCAIELINKVKEQSNLPIDDIYLNLITSCISSHMGKWNYDYKTKVPVLPKPTTRMEKFVHLSDYLASRKCLEFKFDVSVERDSK